LFQFGILRKFLQRGFGLGNRIQNYLERLLAFAKLLLGGGELFGGFLAGSFRGVHRRFKLRQLRGELRQRLLARGNGGLQISNLLFGRISSGGKSP
jgi:hypothetical protein